MFVNNAHGCNHLSAKEEKNEQNCLTFNTLKGAKTSN